MRAKEAAALGGARAEESRFLSTFQTVPKINGQGLSRHGSDIVSSFNAADDSRQEPYERQKSLMARMKRLYRE